MAENANENANSSPSITNRQCVVATPMERARVNEVLASAGECKTVFNLWILFGCLMWQSTDPAAAQRIEKSLFDCLGLIDSYFADRDLDELYASDKAQSTPGILIGH